MAKALIIARKEKDKRINIIKWAATLQTPGNNSYLSQRKWGSEQIFRLKH